MSTTAPLAVTADDLARWQRALMRGHGLWVQTQHDTEELTGRRFVHVMVESVSTPDEPHDCYLYIDGDEVRVECCCAAHVLGGVPCKHVAAALEELHLWPWPLHPVPAQPAPTPPPAESHKCWTCGLTYGSAHQLAVHRSLIHSSAPRSHALPDPEFAAALLADARSVRERMAGAS